MTGSGGLSLHVDIWGAHAGDDIVLLHGFGHHGRIWDDVAVALAELNKRVIAPHLRGHGRSMWSGSCDYSTATLIADVNAAVVALGVRDAVLIGHSLGANVAAHWAVDAPPERLRALVLVEWTPDFDPVAKADIAIRAGDLRRPYATTDEYRLELMRLYPLAHPDSITRLARYGLRSGPEGALIHATDPRFTRDGAPIAETWARLAAIPVPSLIVRGVASSVLTRDKASEMAARLSDAEVVTLRAGHAVPAEDPDGLTAAIIRFLASRIS